MFSLLSFFIALLRMMYHTSLSNGNVFLHLRKEYGTWDLRLKKLIIKQFKIATRHKRHNFKQTNRFYWFKRHFAYLLQKPYLWQHFLFQ